MDNAINKLKRKHELDLFIKLRYYWRKFKVKKQKKLKELEQKKKLMEMNKRRG